MKISENITPINAHKVWMGPKDVVLSLDTDTGRVDLKTPAMFSEDPIIPLDELQTTLDKLAVHMEKANGQEDGATQDHDR